MHFNIQKILHDTTQKHLILLWNKAEAQTDFAMHVKFALQMSVGVVGNSEDLQRKDL